MHPQFQQYNPLRSPSWRFERVTELLDHDPPLYPSRRLDDDDTRECWRFFRLWRRHPPADRRVLLFPRFPDLFYAYSFQHHNDQEWRWVLEAALLAGMSDFAIARELCTLPSAIDKYERIFFNVRDRLGSELWVVKLAIGRAEDRRPHSEGNNHSDAEITSFQMASFLKLFSYFGGERVLRALLSGLSGSPSRPCDPGAVRQWLDEAIRQNVQRQAALASQTMSISKFNALQVIELHAKLVELYKADQSSDNLTEMEKRLEKLIRGVTWGVGVRFKSQKSPLPALEAEAALGCDSALSAVEPRAFDENLEALEMEADAYLRMTPEASELERIFSTAET